MHQCSSHRKSLALAICELGLKNQRLIGQYLDYGMLQRAKQLWQIDNQLSLLFLHHKMLGRSTHYIWHTQDDDKVRLSHAANHNRIFAWDNPPATGHPGEDFNCRCWAEPIGDSKYASQLLITTINDNPNKWTNPDFVRRYRSGIGGTVSLQQTGYLGAVIEHYNKKLNIYKNVEQQIIDAAITNGEGVFTYSFENNYNFGRIFSGLKYSFGSATVRGLFKGDARREQELLVISGIVTYDFYDKFFDPTSKVERLMILEGISREEAIARLGESTDTYGTSYDIEGRWQTKLTATIRIGN